MCLEACFGYVPDQLAIDLPLFRDVQPPTQLDREPLSDADHQLVEVRTPSLTIETTAVREIDERGFQIR